MYIQDVGSEFGHTSDHNIWLQNLVHELDNLAHMGVIRRQDVIEAMELSVRDNPEARM